MASAEQPLSRAASVMLLYSFLVFPSSVYRITDLALPIVLFFILTLLSLVLILLLPCPYRQIKPPSVIYVPATAAWIFEANMLFCLAASFMDWKTLSLVPFIFYCDTVLRIFSFIASLALLNAETSILAGPLPYLTTLKRSQKTKAHLRWGFGGRRRREGDSNPRYSYPYNGFRDRPVQPLWHLSWGRQRYQILANNGTTATFRIFYGTKKFCHS